MRILVTGAAGFIGSHLAEELAGVGHDVVGLDAFTPYYDRSLKERNAAAVRAAGVRLLELDLAVDDLAPALDGVEAVYHLAAQPGLSATTSLATYVRNNITASARLLEAAKARPLSLFVHISTSSVYGAVATGGEDEPPAPTSHYGITKLASEHLALAAARDGSVPACALRIFSVYGPRERPEKLFPLLIDHIERDRPFPLFEGSGEHLRSFTYVGDVVGGCLAALGRADRLRGEVINLGSEQVASTADGIRIVGELMGREPKLRTVPRRAGDQLTTSAVIDKARALLDYEPSTPLREGLKAEVDWFTS
jgi:UDP-glucuronate 4-epimerase